MKRHLLLAWYWIRIQKCRLVTAFWTGVLKVLLRIMLLSARNREAAARWKREYEAHKSASPCGDAKGGE